MSKEESSYNVQNPKSSRQKKILILFSSDNHVANISLYALTRELNFLVMKNWQTWPIVVTLVPIFCYCFTFKWGKVSGDCIWKSVRNKCFSLYLVVIYKYVFICFCFLFGQKSLYCSLVWWRCSPCKYSLAWVLCILNGIAIGMMHSLEKPSQEWHEQ